VAAAYRLIEARFLASQAAARIVQQTTAWIETDGRSSRPTGPGRAFRWLERLLATDAEEESEKPKRAGETLKTKQDHFPLSPETKPCRSFPATSRPSAQKPKPLFSQAALVAELKRLALAAPAPTRR